MFKFPHIPISWHLRSLINRRTATIGKEQMEDGSCRKRIWVIGLSASKRCSMYLSESNSRFLWMISISRWQCKPYNTSLIIIQLFRCIFFYMFLIQSSPKVFVAKPFQRVPPSLFSMDKPISSGSNFGAYLPLAAKATPAPWRPRACVNRKKKQAPRLSWVVCELYVHNYICLCSKYCDHLTFSID